MANSCPSQGVGHIRLPVGFFDGDISAKLEATAKELSSMPLNAVRGLNAPRIETLQVRPGGGPVRGQLVASKVLPETTRQSRLQYHITA
jgi:hypothetical protein